MKLSIACPQCGVEGWVQWKDLRHGLRCPACHCHFLLNHSGKWQSLAELPQVRYTCPRCKQSGSLPSMLAVRQVECGMCGLRLARGPDQQFHEADEARQLHQAALEEARKPPAARLRGPSRSTGDGWLRKPATVWAALLLAGLLCIVALAVGLFGGHSPESRARAFTYSCLAGDWDRAHGYMADDAMQRSEFDRWRVRYFTSILDEHRPAGDSVRVTVQRTSGTAESCVLRVEMKSRFIGTRTHEQHWRKSGDQWFFDAIVTLQAQYRPVTPAGADAE